MCELKIYSEGNLIIDKKFDKEVIKIQIKLGNEMGKMVLRKQGFINVFNVEVDFPTDWKIRINDKVYKDFVIDSLK